MSRGRSVGKATSYKQNDRDKGRIFLFATTPRRALGLAQPPIQWVHGALSLEIRRLECEADLSPQCRGEECVYLYLFLHVFMV
jgi:hypothetical protein